MRNNSVIILRSSPFIYFLIETLFDAFLNTQHVFVIALPLSVIKVG